MNNLLLSEQFVDQIFFIGISVKKDNLFFTPYYQAGSECQNESTVNDQNKQNEDAKNALPDEYRGCLISALSVWRSALEPLLHFEEG